jgi:hypothetical protein
VSYDISSEKTLRREISGLIKAAEMFKCENLLLINFDAEQDVEKKGHAIHVVPAAEWLCQNRLNWSNNIKLMNKLKTFNNTNYNDTSRK